MSFQQGLSGLNATSKALDTIGNNIANSGTIGFKSGSTQFADVFSASLNGAGAAPVGLGTRISAVVQQFTQGNISISNNPLDVAINGGGFFQVDDGLGSTLYSRNGQFQLDKDGFIVNAQGLQLKGIMAVNGVVSPGSPNVALRLFDPTQSLTGSPQATGASVGATGVQANLNLDSRLAALPALPAFNYADPTTFNQSTAVTTYDSLGNPHTYSMYFRKTAANAWDVYATVTNPTGAAPAFTDLGLTGALSFNTSGQLTSAPIAETISGAQLGYAGAVTNMAFNVNFSGSTQYGSPFAVNTLLQDGYAAGTLAGFKIGNDGTLLGNYTNGQTQVVGQAVLATFRNPQGLQPLGNNIWSQTPESGASILGTPGSSGQFGGLQSAALEEANVDLTAELVSMITQQRVYQANAQTIKTQDSILQTLVNLR
ncbi:MAG: flagellar hook protein FlgE [Burkholderiaceae bacterium]|nr:flagellar hook protein FlgE [Sulfuritalea sp.]MCF8174136.1 flagellar hook protein FlgE [Burkholderiaceae bacterium]MCF8185082.1 flagellar hook protein FlgE [Polynucleobacter sp.]